MPTAAKLVAALLWGALGAGASFLARPFFPEGASLLAFAAVNAGMGLVVGWTVAGSRAGTTLGGAVGYGLTASVALGLLILLVRSGGIMLRQSWRRVYDGPAEALTDVVALMGRDAGLVLNARVAGTLILGGVAAGVLTELAGRRWS